jgi:predicted  nucleic acid-binding Zn-ribbon protein
MTGEEMERAIQALIERHAKVSAGIVGLKAAQERTSANLEALAQRVARMEARSKNHRRETREPSRVMNEDLRDGFRRLMLGNEVTRDLARQVAHLCASRGQLE